MKESNKDIFTFLITNKDFRDWVKQPDDERNYFWKEWMAAHPEAFMDVKRAREYIERMTFRKEQLEQHEMDVLLGNIISSKKKKVRPGRQSTNKIDYFTIDQWVKVAAILIICILFTVLIERFVTNEPEIAAIEEIEWKKAENPKGRKSTVNLPDGTIVYLNSGSEIKFPVTFSDTIRLVELKGEAFFKVARDEHKPFIIHTNRMVTEVLGTSFNINAHPFNESQHIAVVEGRVKVSNTLGEAAFLTSNEMVYIDKNNRIDKTIFDEREITGWKDGVISFKRASFIEIEEKLSMWYGVEIIADENFKMEDVYTGEFVHESLENVMHGIAYSSGFKYKISKNNVYVF